MTMMTALTRTACLSLVLLASMTAWADPVAPGPEASPPAAPTLSRAVIARGVDHHLPTGTDAPFTADGERLYVYLEVDNPGAETVYTVRWHQLDNDRHFTQTIEVGHSPRWRTWVYHSMTASHAGQWEVEVVAPDGSVQSTLDFQVVAPSPAGPPSGLQS
jgi:hypothetical protein